MTLITLIYGSSATHKLIDQDLIDILESSHRNNHKNDITGMLLYDDGNFVQVLEGESSVVSATYEKIMQDPRHDNLMVYVKKEIPHRQFGDWEMGFVDIRKIGADQLPGYTRFLQDPEHNLKLEDVSYAYAFLNVFRENVR